ncbi:right-handed parallel beta-helix repeat-containing protein [Phanerochaete sordida]|uniref:Right-handed parallel beta-helix repeat-containing protein n=1 Tax=Phanerochaete sordida TaxID=48140 RepID=A0A9P3FZ88_9APHY|nr:right-handed parallel beta-helix repeat-containing protein [Phanerochaete sordida]
MSRHSRSSLLHRRHVAHHDLFARDDHNLHARDDCEPADPDNTLTDRLNTLLNSSGPGYTLPLCPNTQYLIDAPILFAAPNQEISTTGYPSGDDRAVLVVNGPVQNGQGHTTAVDGTCGNCGGVVLRNVQINGTRNGAGPTAGGANIEMGGGNSDQLIEYVHSFDPRSWSCMHIAEGPFTCNNVTVRHNDVGPCGTDTFQEWADGISVSCQNAYIWNNTINNPTDGGIVLFGSPGTLVENNTIFVETHTLLGGINMVDYLPWKGNYTNTIVRNNLILGGFATEVPEGDETKGTNDDDVIIKIGIAIGPRTWFGDQFGTNVSFSGTVLNNVLTGAFGYGMAISSAVNFTVEGNTMEGNTSFIGARGPNCSTTDQTPSPSPFVVQLSNVQSSTLQVEFQNISDADGLTCILPPDGGDFWPFGGGPTTTALPSPTSSGGGGGGGGAQASNGDNGGLSGGAKAGIAIGVILGVAAVAVATFFIRKAALSRAANRRPSMYGQPSMEQIH